MNEHDLNRAAENFNLDKEEIYGNILSADTEKKKARFRGTKVILIAAAVVLLMAMVSVAAAPALRQYLNLPFLRENTESEEIDHTGFIAVSTPEELDAIRNNLSASYYLTSDIVIPDEYYMEGGLFKGGFTPIGTKKPFTGVLDGNGHTICNLRIDNSDGKFKYCGLIAKSFDMGFDSGAIYKLRIADSEIISDADVFGVGLIVGRGNIIGGCSVENSVIRLTGSIIERHSATNIGLIAGKCILIDSCYADGNVICEDDGSLLAGLLAGDTGSVTTSLTRGKLTLGGEESFAPVGQTAPVPVIINETFLNDFLTRLEEKCGDKDDPRGEYFTQSSRVKAFYIEYNPQMEISDDYTEEEKEQIRQRVRFISQASMFREYADESVYFFDPGAVRFEQELIIGIFDSVSGHDGLVAELYAAGCKYGLMYCYTPETGAASDYAGFDFDTIWTRGDDGVPQLRWFAK